jgi:hypothetical protein
MSGGIFGAVGTSEAVLHAFGTAPSDPPIDLTTEPTLSDPHTLSN